MKTKIDAVIVLEISSFIQSYREIIFKYKNIVAFLETKINFKWFMITILREVLKLYKVIGKGLREEMSCSSKIIVR